MIADYTVQYYEDHAQQFFDNNVNIDMSNVYEKFEKYLKPNDYILDVGCGSGRDSKYFLSKCYKVDPIDRSEKIAKIASRLIGKKVRVTNFLQLDETETYDAIWASASLVHISSFTLPYAFDVMTKALKKNGVLYCSFKYGTFEGIRNGRYFTFLNEQTFNKVIEENEWLKVDQIWITKDNRKDRQNEKWLNIILRKMEK